MARYYYPSSVLYALGGSYQSMEAAPLDARLLLNDGNVMHRMIINDSADDSRAALWDGAGPVFLQKDSADGTLKRGWYYLSWADKQKDKNGNWLPATGQPQWIGIYDKPQVDALIKDLGTIYKVSGNKTLDDILALDLSDESLRGNVYNVSSVGTGKDKGAIPPGKSPDSKEQDVYIGDQILVNAQGKLDNLRGFIDFTDYQTKAIPSWDSSVTSLPTTVEEALTWLYATNRLKTGDGLSAASTTVSETDHTIMWYISLMAATKNTLGGVKASESFDTSKSYLSTAMSATDNLYTEAPGFALYDSKAKENKKIYFDGSVNDGLIELETSNIVLEAAVHPTGQRITLNAPKAGEGIQITEEENGDKKYDLQAAASASLGGIKAEPKDNTGSWTEVKIGSDNKLYVPKADSNTDNTKIVVGDSSISKGSETGVKFTGGTNSDVVIKNDSVEISSKMSVRIDGVTEGITPERLLLRGAGNIYLHYGKSPATALPVSGDKTDYSDAMVTVMNNFGDYGQSFTRYSHATGTTVLTETSKYFHGLVPPAAHKTDSDADQAARANSFLNENGQWTTVESIPTLTPWKIVTGGTDGKITTQQSHVITAFTPTATKYYLRDKTADYEESELPRSDIEYKKLVPIDGEAEWAGTENAGKIASTTGHLLFIDKDGAINEKELDVYGDVNKFYNNNDGMITIGSPAWQNPKNPREALVRIGAKDFTKDGEHTPESQYIMLADYLYGTDRLVEATDINDHNKDWAGGMLTYKYKQLDAGGKESESESFIYGHSETDLASQYNRVIRSYPGIPKHSTDIKKLSTLNWNSRAQQFSYYDWGNHSKYLDGPIKGGGFDTYHNTNDGNVTMNRVFEMGGVETYNTSQGTYTDGEWRDNSQERKESWSTVSNGWLLHIPLPDEERQKYKDELYAEEYDDGGVTKKRWKQPEWLDNWKCNSVIIDKTGLYHTAPANDSFYPIDCVKRWENEIQVLSNDPDKAQEGEWKTLFGVENMTDGFDFRLGGHYAHVKFKNINSDTTGFVGDDQNKYILPKDFKAYITWTDTSENNATEPLVLIKVVVDPNWWWSPELNSMNFNNTQIEVKAALNPKRWPAGTTMPILGLTKVMTGKFIANMSEIKYKVNDIFGLNTTKRITFPGHGKWMGYTPQSGISYADYEKTSTSTWEEDGKTVTQKITDYYYFTQGLFGPETTSGSKTTVSSQTPSAAGESWRSRKTVITRNGATAVATTGYHYFFEDGGVYTGQYEEWNETSKPTAADPAKTVWSMTAAVFPHFYYSTIAEPLDDDKTIKFTFWDKDSDTLKEYDVFVK